MTHLRVLPTSFHIKRGGRRWVVVGIVATFASGGFTSLVEVDIGELWNFQKKSDWQFWECSLSSLLRENS